MGWSGLLHGWWTATFIYNNRGNLARLVSGYVLWLERINMSVAATLLGWDMAMGRKFGSGCNWSREDGGIRRLQKFETRRSVCMWERDTNCRLLKEWLRALILLVGALNFAWYYWRVDLALTLWVHLGRVGRIYKASKWYAACTSRNGRGGSPISALVEKRSSNSSVPEVTNRC